MDLLVSGKTVVRHLTLPEGWTTAQALSLIQNAPGLEGPITLKPAEGALLPETYNYTWGDTRDGMVRRMTRAMDAMLADLWAKRPADSPMTSPDEAKIVAELAAAQGKPVDIGGYYRPDMAKVAAAMRPSATFNAALDAFAR